MLIDQIYISKETKASFDIHKIITENSIKKYYTRYKPAIFLNINKQIDYKILSKHCDIKIILWDLIVNPNFIKKVKSLHHIYHLVTNLNIKKYLAKYGIASKYIPNVLEVSWLHIEYTIPNLLKSSPPLVSIVMNTYNENPEFLRTAINSCLNQLYVNVQLIVSTIEGDPAINFIKKNFNNVDLCISSKKEHPGHGIAGIYYQLNKATCLIKGNWFTYASSNDYIISTKLYNEIYRCQKSNKLVCYSPYLRANENLIINGMCRPKYRNNTRMNLKNLWMQDCCIINAAILKKHLPFNYKKFWNLAFLELYLRIYKKEGNIFIYNPIPGFIYRINKNSLHIKRRKNKSQRILEKKYRKILIKLYVSNIK